MNKLTLELLEAAREACKSQRANGSFSPVAMLRLGTAVDKIDEIDMTTHSRAPFRCEAESVSLTRTVALHIHDADGHTIAWLRNPKADISERDHANARLFVAAPKMLGTLTHFIDALDDGSLVPHPQYIEDARVAIAEVKGTK